MPLNRPLVRRLVPTCYLDMDASLLRVAGLYRPAISMFIPGHIYTRACACSLLEGLSSSHPANKPSLCTILDILFYSANSLITCNICYLSVGILYNPCISRYFYTLLFNNLASWHGVCSM